MRDYTVRECDVLVIGAGGAGLRAAVAAHSAGAKVAVVCRSLLGKAHTVMAEGGIAAALGNVYPQDDWRTHFRDTMRGGKAANNWRMAQLHAQEAPARIGELESWGAVFDRTPDGRMSQRDFGGHRYARLVHIGDRTGLEILRTLQQQAVACGIEVFQEHTVLRLLHANDGEAIAGAVAYQRDTGAFVAFTAKAVVLATGGAGKVAEITSNSWESVGSGHTLALRAGAELIDMEFVQFHPTGMIWPLSVAGILVTEGVRGDGGTLRNADGRRFMFDYVPDSYRAETAETEQEADAWYADHTQARRTPDLLPRDEVARAINAEIKAGRASPHGGVFLDIASRREAAYITKRLPMMYHQFKELAGVDITREAMEVGPTFHYIMGGVRVDPETAASSMPGLYAAGEVAGGMHGANRLGGNSLSDLLVFGRRAGLGAAAHALGREHAARTDSGEIQAVLQDALTPLGRTDGPSPYRLHAELRAVFQSGVGLIRTGTELAKALEEIGQLRERAARVAVPGRRADNPSWGEANDVPVLLDLAEAIAHSALARTESRGGHTRTDYPATDPEWENRHNVVRWQAQGVTVTQVATTPMPPHLRALCD